MVSVKLPTVAGVGPRPWLVLVVSESLPHGPGQLQQLNSAPRSSYSLTKTATGPLCPPGDGVACGPQIFPSLVSRLPNMAQGKVDKAQVPKISPCWPSPNKLLNGPGLGQDRGMWILWSPARVPCRRDGSVVWTASATRRQQVVSTKNCCGLSGQPALCVCVSGGGVHPL